jgi:hypothetical protein
VEDGDVVCPTGEREPSGTGLPAWVCSTRASSVSARTAYRLFMEMFTCLVLLARTKSR